MCAAIAPDQDGWNPRAGNFIATVARLLEYYGNDTVAYCGRITRISVMPGRRRWSMPERSMPVNRRVKQFGMDNTFLLVGRFQPHQFAFGAICQYINKPVRANPDVAYPADAVIH